MSYYQLKILTSQDDITQAEEIFISHSKIMRNIVTIEKDVLFRNMINAGHIFVGAFNADNRLDAFMTYKFYTQIPYCQIGNIYTRQGVFNSYKFSRSDNPIPEILDFILRDVESKKYYTWYYCRSNLEIYNRLEKKEGLLRWSAMAFDSEKNQYRYNRYVEEIIPKNTSSKFLLHTKMFALGLWNTEIIIFKCCLKPEYREWNYHLTP
jgi:hypothetical protein